MAVWNEMIKGGMCGSISTSNSSSSNSSSSIVFYLGLNLDRFITFNKNTMYIIIFNITILNSYIYIHNYTKAVKGHNTNIALARIIQTNLVHSSQEKPSPDNITV